MSDGNGALGDDRLVLGCEGGLQLVVGFAVDTDPEPPFVDARPDVHGLTS